MKRKAAYIQLTRKCNNECIFCSNPQFDKEFTFKEALSQIKKLKDKENINEIILTGGEPTEVSFLRELIIQLKNISINPRIITNGVNLSDENYVHELAKVGLKDLNISIHSHIEEDADQMSKKQGHFKKTLKGIRNAINEGMFPQFNLTINSINCKYLSKTISFLIKNFPEINHYIFNNLDSGKSDSNILNRASKNSWIIAKLIDLEVELSKTAKLLKKNKKTFRIERVPLCYMEGFEEFSTEAREIIKDEKYICFFLEKEKENLLHKRDPRYKLNQSSNCKVCNLNSICAGLDQSYSSKFGFKELYPIFSYPDNIIKKVKDEKQ